MKVVVAAGGRFHALQLARELAKRDSLKKLVTFSYTRKDKNLLDPNYVSTVKSCKLMDIAYNKLKLSHLISPTSFNAIKDNLFDQRLNKRISNLGTFDIFVGWTNYFFNSFLSVKISSATIVAESGSAHVQEQEHLLKQEYELFGLKADPIHSKTLEKMQREYNYSDYIMTLSNYSRQSFLKRGFAPSKILQTTCGFDVEDFLQARENSSLQPQKFRVIFVGLLCMRKGIHYLLKAWEKLNLPASEAELVLVGVMQNDLRSILNRLPIKKNVIFQNSVNRNTLAKLYQTSSVFVLPSVEDGFGMVMGEAMASQIPVICTQSTGGPDIIENNKHGFIVQPRNVDELAEKILWCYKNQDTTKEMGIASQQHIQNFTWDKYGDSVFDIYQKILEKKREQN